MDFVLSCFFFNDTATTEIYTLSLHDALPIYRLEVARVGLAEVAVERAEHRGGGREHGRLAGEDAREVHPGERSEEHTSELQSANISYAVFCLKKKRNTQNLKTTIIEYSDTTC